MFTTKCASTMAVAYLIARSTAFMWSLTQVGRGKEILSVYLWVAMICGGECGIRMIISVWPTRNKLRILGPLRRDRNEAQEDSKAKTLELFRRRWRCPLNVFLGNPRGCE